jgi:hypothetical protein
MPAVYGFSPGYWTSDHPPTSVEYQAHTYAAPLTDYSETVVSSVDTRIYATYTGGPAPIPYIVQGENLWYVNGLPHLGTDYPDPSRDAPTLIFADVLHDFFHTRIAPTHHALVRLEDVAATIDPAKIVAAVDYLSSEQIPFAIGVIPAQPDAHGHVISLGDKPGFVSALRYAQSHGGTIILHGYHHAYGTSEDYEFWDPARNAPPVDESWDRYAAEVKDGIRILRNYGIEPQLWETPHYAASPLAYRVFASFFSYAFENRPPTSWLPYPAGPDAYGQMLIPENLGYINPADGKTVQLQLQRADFLRIVRDGWAVGYYHPAGIPVDQLKALVQGLRQDGYTFVDLHTFSMRVYDGYRPGVRGQMLRAMTQVKSWIPWWGVVHVILWPWLFGVALISGFLWRLRAQWHPRASEAGSMVESRSSVRGQKPSRWWHHLKRILLPLAIAGILLGSAWALSAADSRASDDVALGSSSPSGAANAVDHQYAAPVTSDGWELSVYYTAVEQFYTGPTRAVYGCLRYSCTGGNDLIGSYAADFLDAVKREGSGRITSGLHAGAYVNWAIDAGYWLDSIPRDARGLPLEPYQSAAADVSIPLLTRFQVTTCGAGRRTGAPIAVTTCDGIRAATWAVRDRFAVGAAPKRIDLYVGEEDQAEFIAKSPRVLASTGATLSIQTALLPTDGR